MEARQVESHVAMIEKTCLKCGNQRKFTVGSKRDNDSICGECWDWKSRA